jgi:hypothetical protein
LMRANITTKSVDAIFIVQCPVFELGQYLPLVTI